MVGAKFSSILIGYTNLVFDYGRQVVKDTWNLNTEINTSGGRYFFY
jgi:hypothetical protein